MKEGKNEGKKEGKKEGRKEGRKERKLGTEMQEANSKKGERSEKRVRCPLLTSIHKQ